MLFIGENFGNQSLLRTFLDSRRIFCLTIQHKSWIFPLRNATNRLLKAFLDLEKSRFKVDWNFSIFQVFLNRNVTLVGKTMVALTICRFFWKYSKFQLKLIIFQKTHGANCWHYKHRHVHTLYNLVYTVLYSSSTKSIRCREIAMIEGCLMNRHFPPK